jgi:hypothetical protein
MEQKQLILDGSVAISCPALTATLTENHGNFATSHATHQKFGGCTRF